MNEFLRKHSFFTAVRTERDRQFVSRLFSGAVFGGLVVYTLSSTLTISGVTGGLILASIGWIGNIVLRKGRVELTFLNVLPLVFLFTILVSTARSGEMMMGLDRFRSMAIRILLYYIVISEILSERSLRWLARSLVVGALIAVVYQIGMLALDVSRFEELALNRALGGMLGMVIPFSVSLFLVESGKKWRIALALSSVLMTICLILTSTRGAWIGCFIGISFLGMMKNKRILLLLLLVVALFLVFSPKAQLRRALSVFDPADSTIRKRVYLWQSAFSMARENLLFGRGAGSYKQLYRDHLPEGTAELIRPDHAHAHNIFIHTLAETGIMGLSALVVLLVVVVRRIWRVYKRQSDPWLKALALGVLAGVVGFLVHGQVDYTLAGRTGFLFWFYVGLVHHAGDGGMKNG